MEDKIIISKHNKKFKMLKKLSLPKYRKEMKYFLAEGLKFLSLGIRPKEIFVSQSFSESEFFNKGLKNLDSISIISDDLFRELSSQISSQGVLSLFSVPEEKNIEGKVVLVLDCIQDPGNLGTIIRTAEYFGVKDIVLCDGSADPYSPKVVRGSMGAILSVNLVSLSPEKVIYLLKEKNYIVATTSSNDYKQDIRSFNEERKIALVMGNESRGVSDCFNNSSTLSLGIQRVGKGESLNVGVATSIILSHILK